MQETNDQTFDQDVKSSTIPVLVDFYADWCMPCKMLTPTLEKVEVDYAGKVKFVKANTDFAREQAKEHKVSSIPNLVLYKDGVQVHQVSGLVKEADLRTMLDDLLF